jgi:serine protease Do
MKEVPIKMQRALLSAAMMLGVTAQSWAAPTAAVPAAPGSAVVASGPATVSAAPVVVRGLPDFADLVEQVAPMVVNIRTSARVDADTDADGDPDQQMQDFFRHFFGVPMPNLPRQGPRSRRAQPPGPGPEVPKGVGSGFILTPDGYVMTNAHVIEGADEVTVTLADKREFKAKVIGADKRTDVAVVKIDASNLPAARIGDVSKLRVGEWVMAIGSPFGLDNTVTAGIVSAKQRDTGDYLPFIQTDVAVNPGNSGGPLINMRGQVVGINSQIYSRSGGFMGISFAIPIDEAIRVSDQLRASGHVTRGRIGVRIDQVSREVAEAIGLGKPQGALVRQVQADSPAAKAGVEPGDIITRFSGQTIDNATDLPRLVGDTKPGTRASLTVFRRGQTRDLTLTIAEMDGDSQTAAGGKSPDTQMPGTRSSNSPATRQLGLTLSGLTAEQRRDLGVPRGVRVDAVSGAAVQAGLRPGDVILSVGNTEIHNTQELDVAVDKALGHTPRKPINMLIQRNDLVQFILVWPKPKSP